MIFVYHSNNKVHSVESDKDIAGYAERSISTSLFELAAEFPDQWLIWCDITCKELLNYEMLSDLFHQKRMMHSCGNSGFLGPDIGFVENSPFIKINREVQYPTWQMSAKAGGIHSSVLNTVEKQVIKDVDFSYFLNSLAKVLMPLGLFCYHNPELLKKPVVNQEAKATAKTLFRFVKQHYKTRWLFFLFINLWVYKKQFYLGSLLSVLLYKKRTLPPGVLDAIPLQSSKSLSVPFSVDVVIPTIGRTSYIKTVINDLAKQTKLPEKVIIVEQNPDSESESDLKDFLKKNWTFEIKHIFTHQTGACYARNLGLQHVTADWVFLGDDDNVLGHNLIEDIFKKVKTIGTEAITTCYLQKNESRVFNKIVQWHTFGAGNSFVKKSLLNDIQFDETMEHGYGEDADFGMQLRNKGVDVIYVPEPSILHLKAPVGGFRTKPVLPWHHEEFAPKPSPTIMRFYQKHRTQEQILGYKTGLFLRHYRKQSIKNPLKYYKRFKQQWNKSVFWANKLAINNKPLTNNQ